MGPGGLYLATKMCRSMELQAGSKILDLGCGNGLTSCYLAGKFHAHVFAVDLWVSPEKIFQFTREKDQSLQVIPLNLDITKSIPFASEYFDAIFCMDAIHYFGGSLEFMTKLLRTLKPGGCLGIGSPCFSREFFPEELGSLPNEYDNGTNLWPKEFSRYHSAAWWKDLVVKTEAMDFVKSNDLDDGVILWEDELAFNIEKWGWEEERANRDYSEISYGYNHSPYLTHFILTAKKKNQPHI